MNIQEGVVIPHEFTNSLGEKEVVEYQIGKYLGKGGFAEVFELLQLHSKKKFAVKIISKKSLKKNRQKQKLFSEIRIHKNLIHRNIVKFDMVFEDELNVFIVLELCINQTMNELLKRRKVLTEFEVKIYS